MFFLFWTLFLQTFWNIAWAQEVKEIPIPLNLLEESPESEYIKTLPGYGSDNELESSFLPAVMKFITASVGGISVMIFLVSGFMMITSFGDSEQREKAKKMLYWSILGIIFIVLAYAIVQGVTSLEFGWNT